MEIRKTKVKNQTLEHKEDNTMPRHVAKHNNMQKQNPRPPMTGRNKTGTDKGELGRSFADYFGENKAKKNYQI